MKIIFTFLSLCFFFTSNVFSQSCNNWLKISKKLDAVTVGDLDITGNQVTIEANFNATGDTTRTIVSKHNYQVDVNYFLTPDIAEITTTNGFFLASAQCNFIKNKTYHVAMVYDGASLRFYRNGFLLDSIPATGDLITNNWPTTIGEYAYALSTNNSGIAVPMEGYINEVRIWNVARTQAQIRTYMNSSLPTPAAQTGLLGYYTFDNLTNKQGNAGYNGVIHNGAIINATNVNCNFVADSCLPSTACERWLKITNKLDAVTIGDLDITGNKITVEATFNATGDITRSLVSKHNYSADVNYFLLPDVAEITTTNGFFLATSSCTYIKNKTYHVAMVYDGISLKFYRNGFLLDSIPATGNLITNNWPTTIGE